MSFSSLFSDVGQWFSSLSLHWRIVLVLVVVVLSWELGMGRWAPRSRLYQRWKSLVEAVGAVWTAVILSVIYLLSVGPVSLAMRLGGKDLLDTAPNSRASSWHAHDPNPLGAEAAARHQF